MAITTAASIGLVGNGDYPQINRGVAYDVPHFYSDGFPNSSTMLVSVKMKAGFGWIEQGTVIAEDANGEFVPYVPTTYSDNVAVSPVLADVALNATTLTVSELESGKYAVGDNLILADAYTTPVYFDAGAITDISVTGGIATITFTNATTVDTFTTARSAHVYVKTGTSGKYSTAKFILDKPVDTGAGSSALGAQCSAIVKNAVIYSAPLFNLDTAAKTALGVVSYGNRAFI